MGIIKDNPAKKSPVAKEIPTYDKSIIETDPYLRSKRPFVKLSKKMEDFVEGIRALAKNDTYGLIKVATKAMSEGDDSAGGFLVPEEFNTEVIRYMEEGAVVRPRARVFTMARDILSFPTLDQSSYSFGGVTAYWPEESGLKAASQPVLGKLTLKVNKLIGLCPVSDELLEDSAINLANFLVALFAEAINYEEDKQFLAGTGMGVPLGIIPSIPSANVITRGSSTRILLADIISMYTTLPAWADKNAVWITNKSGLGQLMLISSEATSGIAMWMSNLRDAIIPTIMGKPIILTEKVSSLGTKGDIIFGDLSYYFIGDRGGLKVDSSIHDRYRYDETTFRFVKRVDGQPSIAKAFVALRE